VVPSEELAALLQENIPQEGLTIQVGGSEEVMRRATIGILKSGTCTLEAAFWNLPFVCIYKASPVSAFLARRLVEIAEVSLVNIVRPGTVKELLQERCTSELATEEVVKILEDARYREDML
jgi:lipid-A-disaccharide synthase